MICIYLVYIFSNMIWNWSFFYWLGFVFHVCVEWNQISLFSFFKSILFLIRFLCNLITCLGLAYAGMRMGVAFHWTIQLLKGLVFHQTLLCVSVKERHEKGVVGEVSEWVGTFCSNQIVRLPLEVESVFLWITFFSSSIMQNFPF